MKKYNLYFWLLALIGVITSCSQDETLPTATRADRVTIGASINRAIQSRAASVTVPTGHKLRYVLEVWGTGDGATLVHKNEMTATDNTAVNFEFTLETAGKYKALLWADFVVEGAAETSPTSPNAYTHYADNHYTTTSLKAVALAKMGDDYKVNTESRDAFFATMEIDKETGAYAETVELTRPFGQINIIEKKTDLIAEVGEMTITYNVPQTFNVETGTPENTTVAVNPKVESGQLPTATTDRKANLFYDFIFAPATGQTTLGAINLKFTTPTSTVQLAEFPIPANMPVVRNKRTNISGNILQASVKPSNDAKLTVTVDDTWTTPDEEKEVVRAPKVGDFYYADGTWSSTYTSDASNPCIGIVFQIDLSRIGAKEKEVLAAKGVTTPHGLVISLKTVTKSFMIWGEDHNFSELTECTDKDACNADINGLLNYTTVITYAEQNGNLDNFSAFKAVKEYAVTAPEKTTGWYLPSIGQWYDFTANLGGLQSWDNAIDEGNELKPNLYKWDNQTELASKINAYFEPLGSGNYDAIPNGNYQKFFSSSTYSNSEIWTWFVSKQANVVQCWHNARSNADGAVRPILAF